MKITFDPEKNETNEAKHGVPLTFASRLDWDGMLVNRDRRRDYGEDRYIGIALLGDRLYSVVYTPRDEIIRVISLRRASQKEFDAYYANDED